jgi:hypothetical protein
MGTSKEHSNGAKELRRDQRDTGKASHSGWHHGGRLRGQRGLRSAGFRRGGRAKDIWITSRNAGPVAQRLAGISGAERITGVRGPLRHVAGRPAYAHR